MENYSKKEPYYSLIDKFLKFEISASFFENQYLKMFKNQVDPLPDKEYTILNSLFCDVDAYCDDPDLRDEGDIDEESLRKSARLALEKMNSDT